MRNSDSLLKSLVRISEEVEERVKECREQESIIDKTICDLMHYIELTPRIPASKHAEIISMIKESTKQRRKIKDEISALHSYVAPIAEKTKDCHVKMQKAKVRKGKRKYEPRVLRELFGTEK